MSHDYIPPSEIGGGPAEVEREALAQITDLFDEVVVQVRGAFMTRILDQQPSTTPGVLAVEWEESDRKASCDRIKILIEQL